MKLVELLAKELKEWPSNCKTITQDSDGDVGVYGIAKPKLVNGDKSGHVWHHNGHIKNLEELSSVASDASTAIVTRSDWQAARAKLKPAAKAKGDGWVRNRGRTDKAPVGDDAIVVPKLRSGNVGIARQAKQLAWRHTGELDDIMRYCVKIPAMVAQSDRTVIVETLQEQCAGLVGSVEALKDAGPLEWRNRVFELDAQRAEVDELYQRQSAEIAQERESLISKLAAEGFALIERVNAQIAECVVKHEGMDDWRNWKCGDVVEFIKADGDISCFTLGKHYVVADVNSRSYNPVSVQADDDGDYNGWKGEYFKWHSRPAK